MIKLWYFFLKDNELIKKLELLSFFYNFEIDERYVFIVCDHVKFGQDEVLVYLVDGSIENVSI